MPQCDFCPLPNATHVYPTHTFTITAKARPDTTLVATSIADWSACDECAVLIDSNNGAALVDRAVDLILAKHKHITIPRPILRRYVAKWHAAFYANRKTTS